jgi:hypothetical protein
MLNGEAKGTLPNSNICWSLGWSYLDYGGWLIGTCDSRRTRNVGPAMASSPRGRELFRPLSI